MKKHRISFETGAVFVAILIVATVIIGICIKAVRENKLTTIAAEDGYKSFGVFDSKIDSVSYLISDSLGSAWKDKIEQLDRKVYKLQTLYPDLDLKALINEDINDLYQLPSPKNILGKNRVEDDIELSTRFSQKYLEFDEQMRTRYRAYRDGKKVDFGWPKVNKDRLYQSWVHVELNYDPAKKSYLIKGKIIIHGYGTNASLPKYLIIALLSCKFDEVSAAIDDVSKLLKIK